MVFNQTAWCDAELECQRERRAYTQIMFRCWRNTGKRVCVRMVQWDGVRRLPGGICIIWMPC